MLNHTGLLSMVFKIRKWLHGVRKAPKKTIGSSSLKETGAICGRRQVPRARDSHPSLVRAAHYSATLCGLIVIALLSMLGKRPCRWIVGPILTYMRSRPVRDRGRILVTHYGLGMGDTIVFLPILRALLSAELDPAPIIVMSSRSELLVGRLYGDTSRITFYDASLGWRHARQFFRRLGKQSISLVLDFTIDTRLWQWEAMRHFFMGNRVVGFLDQDGIRNHYDETTPVDRKQYIAGSFAGLLELHTGIKVDRTRWDEFPLSSLEQEKVERFFAHHGIAGKRMVAVFPTTGRFKKGVDLAAWPYFGELVERLCESSDSDDQVVVLFGERKHRDHLESLVPKHGDDKVICAYDFTVSEVAEIIRQASCVVTTNSGFLHIACNLHVPTVLFPTPHINIWVPDNGYAHLVFCAKCARKQACTARPPLQRNCYPNISVDRVLQRIAEVQRDIVVSATYSPTLLANPHHAEAP